MSSAWGGSWGKAWGNSWGAINAQHSGVRYRDGRAPEYLKPLGRRLRKDISDFPEITQQMLVSAVELQLKNITVSSHPIDAEFNREYWARFMALALTIH